MEVGWEAQEERDICIHIVDLPHCTAETYATIESNCSPTKKLILKEKKKIPELFLLPTKPYIMGLLAASLLALWSSLPFLYHIKCASSQGLYTCCPLSLEFSSFRELQSWSLTPLGFLYLLNDTGLS